MDGNKDEDVSSRENDSASVESNEELVILA